MAKNIFDDYSYKIKKIELEDDCININKLEESQASLVYLTPAHQYPKGNTISIKKRQELLLWAKRKNAIIIEDDYDSEMCYYNRPIPSLQGLDKNNSVVYLGTFSKSLSPSLRVSYMVLPYTLLEKYKKNFAYHHAKVPLMIQKTLEEFMALGYWDRHLRKIRTINKKKHNLMKEFLLNNLKNQIRIENEGAGLCISINPIVNIDWEKLELEAKKEQIKLYYAKNSCDNDWNAIRMGFGGFEEKDLETALKKFVKVFKNCINKN